MKMLPYVVFPKTFFALSAWTVQPRELSFVLAVMLEITVPFSRVFPFSPFLPCSLAQRSLLERKALPSFTHCGVIFLWIKDHRSADSVSGPCFVPRACLGCVWEALTHPSRSWYRVALSPSAFSSELPWLFHFRTSFRISHLSKKSLALFQWGMVFQDQVWSARILFAIGMVTVYKTFQWTALENNALGHVYQEFLLILHSSSGIYLTSVLPPFSHMNISGSQGHQR